ncbi:WD40 repeat-like protein [Eremomyces bilateralis CBS 781.70]|uniref:WD40 repeat-like protein n=1 Tax=Eremomyces bilateralis CBS 781.70 TaxID=1392243 RepID=A0A6G1G269_9PEZI|nr:WD40 repeat-like protein [Eremomyces bilateralis CBS 781.70]KAF1812154.1 WD40 repeat-like protein [Eremomyces bilateralis CBS 781.70]
MTSLTSTSSGNLGLPANSYIYSITPLTAQVGFKSYAPVLGPGRMAALCSDDSVRFFDPERCSAGQSSSGSTALHNVNSSVTALCRWAADGEECKNIFTTGRDGLVRLWDLRSGKKSMELSSPKSVPMSALGASYAGNCIAAGMELEKNGPAETLLFLWDPRKPGSPSVTFEESHTDTITEIQFHPEKRHLMLTGSTDSLINIFDIRQTEEDDALIQVINHRSAIHHCGFLSDDNIYGLGTDETLSFYTLSDPDSDQPDPNPAQLGDVRESLECDYVVDVVRAGGDWMLVAGSFTEKRVDLVPLRAPNSKGSLSWTPDTGSRVRISGAHGEELVRDVYAEVADANNPIVITCGEDGFVRSWKSGLERQGRDSVGKSSVQKSKSGKSSGKGEKARFKPY